MKNKKRFTVYVNGDYWCSVCYHAMALHIARRLINDPWIPFDALITVIEEFDI